MTRKMVLVGFSFASVLGVLHLYIVHVWDAVLFSLNSNGSELLWPALPKPGSSETLTPLGSN